MKRLLVVMFILAVVVGAVSAQDMMYTLTLGGNSDLGPFLVDSAGMTLYIFTNDTAGVSNCADQCATNWPPLTIGEDENVSVDPAIAGWVVTITRADGTRQVTYNGAPLYTFVKDTQPGDTTGHLANDVWFVAAMPTVGLGSNAELGDFLVGPNGMTLYTFANDAPGVSNCADKCAENWPPLLVESADALTLQPGLVGSFGVIERADGGMQVTLNDMPLYYFFKDEKPGDSTGQNAGDVWFVAKLPTLNAVANDEFDSILVGPNGMTLYTFANDSEGVSNCYDQCAIKWPPLYVVAGEEITTSGDVMGELGTSERTDGTLIVTYNGEPLYYWIKDIVPGDTTGHNVGDVWFVAKP